LRDNDGGPTVVGLSDEVRNDLYMRLLASFSEKPMELVGNMLAGMLVGCIEGMVEDENFDEVYAEFHSGDTAGE
jgi:sugar (pentulose or hexulose) kinase